MPAAACRTSLGGGSLLGIAAALKATAAVYAPGVLIGALLVRKRPSSLTSILLAFCVGWGVSFVTIFGWWGHRVFQMTKSPLFPMLNNLFRSDWYPPVNVFYQSIKPHGLFNTIFYPFFWFNKNITVAEARFCDGRFACAMLAVALLSTTAAVRT
jgi:hypothetical protein